MEGFQAEDRHNPLPHIAPLTTTLKSAYNNRHSCLLVPVPSCRNSRFRVTGMMVAPDCSAASLAAAGLRGVCYRAKAAAFPGQMITRLQASPFCVTPCKRIVLLLRQRVLATASERADAGGWDRRRRRCVFRSEQRGKLSVVMSGGLSMRTATRLAGLYRVHPPWPS